VRLVLLVVGLVLVGIYLNTFRHVSQPVVGAVSQVARNAGHPSAAPKGRSRISGVFRNGGEFASEVRTSNVRCSWSARDIVISARITNITSKRLVVRWHPTYGFANYVERGSDPSSTQQFEVAPARTLDVEVRDHPVGVETGTGIVKCLPSFASVQRR
jgi:hypothetical protein